MLEVDNVNAQWTLVQHIDIRAEALFLINRDIPDINVGVSQKRNLEQPVQPVESSKIEGIVPHGVEPESCKNFPNTNS